MMNIWEHYIKDLKIIIEREQRGKGTRVQLISKIRAMAQDHGLVFKETRKKINGSRGQDVYGWAMHENGKMVSHLASAAKWVADYKEGTIRLRKRKRDTL